MKRSGLSRTIVAIAMMLIEWLPSLAHDFEVDGVFYKKTSDNAVAVTYKGYYYDSYSDEYEGNIVIPSSVDYNGTTYSVTRIGDWAFSYCYDLTGIEIPNSVTSIEYYAFSSCSSLTSIVVDAGNSIYDSRNDCNAIIETASNTLIAGCQNTIIPNSVTSIGEHAFNGCKSLTSIEIPNSVTSIGNYAFEHCTSLTSIEIPNSVTSIGYAAFDGCTSLTSVVIGNSVTSIGNYAFRGCKSLTSIEIPNSVTSIVSGAFSGCTSLTSVVIGNSVTSIGYGAFSDCSSLTKITCLATTPPVIGSEAFSYSNYSADLFVPAGCKEAYEATKYWKSFTNIIEIGEPNVNLFIDDFAINAGETKELAINLINAIAFTGFQVDIYIPS